MWLCPRVVLRTKDFILCKFNSNGAKRRLVASVSVKQNSKGTIGASAFPRVLVDTFIFFQFCGKEGCHGHIGNNNKTRCGNMPPQNLQFTKWQHVYLLSAHICNITFCNVPLVRSTSKQHQSQPFSEDFVTFRAVQRTLDPKLTIHPEHHKELPQEFKKML